MHEPPKLIANSSAHAEDLVTTHTKNNYTRDIERQWRNFNNNQRRKDPKKPGMNWLALSSKAHIALSSGSCEPDPPRSPKL